MESIELTKRQSWHKPVKRHAGVWEHKGSNLPRLMPEPWTVEEARAMPSIYHWFADLGRMPINPANVLFPRLWVRPEACDPDKATHEVTVTATWPDGGRFDYVAHYASAEGATWGLEAAMRALEAGEATRRRRGRTITAYAGPKRGLRIADQGAA